jgi:hypothetical protein
MEVSGHLHDPTALPRDKRPRYPFERRLGGPQGLSGRGGEKKKIPSLHLLGIESRPSSLHPSLYIDWATAAPGMLHVLYKVLALETKNLVVGEYVGYFPHKVSKFVGQCVYSCLNVTRYRLCECIAQTLNFIKLPHPTWAEAEGSTLILQNSAISYIPKLHPSTSHRNHSP